MFNEQYAKLVAKFGKRNVLIGAVVMGVIVLGWIANGIGGGNRMNDKAIERALEDASGGRVDVDSDDGTYTVKTEEGTWSTSDKLPEDWPADAPLYPGADVQGSVAAVDGGYGVGRYVGLLTSDDTAKVVAWYKSELVAKGWTVTTDISTGDGSMLGADKDERTLAVMVSPQDGKTAIGLTIATK
jgi:hypothetical protein